MDEVDDNFVKCLSIPPELRQLKDIHCIRAYFKTIDALKSFKLLKISDFARIARYEHYEANSILYRRGDVCTSWYIVLSGCVLVGQTMFFPRFSFGHRLNGNLHRYDECVILEKTELITFDYSQERHTQVTSTLKKQNINSVSIKEVEIAVSPSTPLSTLLANTSYINGLMSKRSSHTSDTSSTYSGCDILSANSGGNVSYASDNEDDDADLDSLSQDNYSVSDTFIDVTMKSPHLRTESDIEIILDEIQNLPAFIKFTSKTKYELCKVMGAVLVHRAEEKLMYDGQVIDTWIVLINGRVEVRHKDGTVQEITRGTSYGVKPSMDEQKQVGDMWTVSEKCHFVSVMQEDFCDIMSRNHDSIIPEIENNGKIDLVYEERKLSPDSSKTGKFVVKGTPEKLISILIVNQQKNDPMYIEDFLLTYRVFVKSPKVIAEKFCECYDAEPQEMDTKIKATIRKILIMWAYNHFADLDDPDYDMSEYFERFENIFSNERHSIGRDKSVFFMACSTNSKPRSVTIDVDNNFLVNLPFRLVGLQKGWGLFIKEVNRSVVKDNYGLRRGDQILSLANQSWERIETLHKASELLNSQNNRSIELVIKYNPSDFQGIMEYLSDCESGIECESSHSEGLGMSNSATIHGLNNHVRNGLSSTITPMEIPSPFEFTTASSPTKSKTNPRSANASPTRHTPRIKTQKYNTSVDREKPFYNIKSPNLSSLTNRSTSNPDLKALDENSENFGKDNLSHVSQVIKVYRPHSSEGKLVLITNNTTAKEVVPLIMKEYSIDLSEVKNYSLFMVKVEQSTNNPLMVKTSRVALYFKDLAGKLSLNQRYYLKNNQTDVPLISDDQVKVLLNESQITLSQLSAFEIATRLTLFDYIMFRNIKAAEYINFVFGLPSLNDTEETKDLISSPGDKVKRNLDGFSNGYENYKSFEKIINTESFWPATEICMEPSIAKRADLIKKFIKVAKICRELKNFNSLLCIITGLSLSPVDRLKASWDKVPNKFLKLYEELKSITDMRFNFHRIRQLVSPEHTEPPLIPCLFLHSKDLTAMHLGNKNCTKDGLINFEKLRMMASEIRKLMRMCNTVYNLQSILSSVRNRKQKTQSSISVDESDATSGISGCSNNSDNYAKKGRSNSVDQFALNRTLKKRNIKRKSTNISENSSKTPKKIYEEWLSTLKFKSYFDNFQVERNIDHLHSLSQNLEPPQYSPVNISSNIKSPGVTETKTTENVEICKEVPSPKSRVSTNICQSKPIASATVLSHITVSQTSTGLNNKTLNRPHSIFSCQNQDDINKIMELVSSTKKVPKKQQLTPDNDKRTIMRNTNSMNDKNILINIPMYNKLSFLQELSAKTQLQRENNIANFVRGGATINLQQSHMIQMENNRMGYYYPPIDVSANTPYYSDRKKCMKPDLPSYETARAISQYQKLSNNKTITQYYPPNSSGSEISSSRPPLHPNKSPKLPSYNQSVSRTNLVPQEVVLHSVPKRNAPTPPPRSVTMLRSPPISNSPVTNKNSTKIFQPAERIL